MLIIIVCIALIAFTAGLALGAWGVKADAQNQVFEARNRFAKELTRIQRDYDAELSALNNHYIKLSDRVDWDAQFRGDIRAVSTDITRRRKQIQNLYRGRTGLAPDLPVEPDGDDSGAGDRREPLRGAQE